MLSILDCSRPPEPRLPRGPSVFFSGLQAHKVQDSGTRMIRTSSARKKQIQKFKNSKFELHFFCLVFVEMFAAFVLKFKFGNFV